MKTANNIRQYTLVASISLIPSPRISLQLKPQKDPSKLPLSSIIMERSKRTAPMATMIPLFPKEAITTKQMVPSWKKKLPVSSPTPALLKPPNPKVKVQYTNKFKYFQRDYSKDKSNLQPGNIVMTTA